MPFEDSDIVDLVSGTLRELGRSRFQQIAQTLQDYEMMGKWLRKGKVVFDSGRGIQRNLMTALGGAAAHKGLFEVDNVDIPTLMSQLNVQWRHADTYWAFERRETLMNRGKALVFNVVKPRRAGAMIDLAEELEDKAWSAPAVANKTEPYGVPYYIVKSATTGFNGGNPGSHTSCAGIDSDTVSGWKNYTYQYTDVSKPDLIKGMRTGYRKTKWKSPVSIKDYRGSMGQKKRYYTNEATLSTIEDLGEAQNENLGRDIASMDDNMVFRKIPILWVPKLDSDSQNPIYQIDHTTFYVVCLKGDYLRETTPAKAANQHNVFNVFVDLTYNFLCVDRRRNAVYATA